MKRMRSLGFEDITKRGCMLYKIAKGLWIFIWESKKIFRAITLVLLILFYLGIIQIKKLLGKYNGSE
jgi:hypothetical protein